MLVLSRKSGELGRTKKELKRVKKILPHKFRNPSLPGGIIFFSPRRLFFAAGWVTIP